MNNKTLCLVMIVKNESKVIKRCLDSVKHLIDYYVICDTGSTDNTKKIIKETLQEIPGQIYDCTWTNFGFNRTLALEYAKEKTDYAIILDADMVTLDYGFNKNELSSDGYLIRYAGALDYAQLLLVKNHEITWKYIGVTHEYLNSSSKNIKEITNLKIQHFCDSNNRKDKFIRDIQLLEKGIQQEPQNSRYYFYLANSYRDNGNYEKAIEYYQKRILFEGWEEEIYYSKYMIGICLERLNQLAEAMVAYLSAWLYRPTRLEALYRLTVLLRETKDYKAAYYFSCIGVNTPYPKDILFIEKNIYTFLLYMEKSIAAYWLGKYQEAIENCKFISNLQNIPQHIQIQNQKNLQYSLHANRKFTKEEAFLTLKKINAICQASDIPYFVMAGTLLGIIRENEFLLHDDDIDIGILDDKYADKIKNLLLNEGFNFYGQFGKKDESLQYRFFYSHIQIDIFFYYEKNKQYYMTSFDNKGNTYKYYWNKFQIDKLNFKNISINIPSNPEQFLETQYGTDWCIPKKDYDYINDAKNIK